MRFWAIGVAAGLWAAAAILLWQTAVPGDLELPSLEAEEVFGARHVERSGRYESGLRLLWVGWTLVELAVLGVAVWLAARLRLRGIAAGVLLGAVTLAAVWTARLPLIVTAHWWRRRYDVSRSDYGTILLDPWLERLGSLAAAGAAIALAMVLARRLGDRWWLAGGPAFALLASFFLLVQPFLLAPRLEPLADRKLAGEIQELARQQGVGEVDVEVRDAARRTRAMNAEFYGIGPTKRVVLWDTALDGRLTRAEIRSLAAHELAHVQADHVWKGIAWVVLFSLPGAYLVARVTRRRGGLGEPGAVPLALLTIAVLQLALLPATTAISRRYEREADWLALRATRDAAAQEGLTRKLAQAALAEPDPPALAQLALETHPSPVDRIALARSGRATRRGAAPRAGS
jgi:STE24 endopeptidase